MNLFFFGQHVMNLINNLVSLEKIVIDPVRRWCHPCVKDRPVEELKAEVKARDHHHATHYGNGCLQL